MEDELLSGQIEKFCCSARRCSAVLKQMHVTPWTEFVQFNPVPGSTWEAQGADIKALSVKGACHSLAFWGCIAHFLSFEHVDIWRFLLASI